MSLINTTIQPLPKLKISSPNYYTLNLPDPLILDYKNDNNTLLKPINNDSNYTLRKLPTLIPMKISGPLINTDSSPEVIALTPINSSNSSLQSRKNSFVVTSPLSEPSISPTQTVNNSPEKTPLCQLSESPITRGPSPVEITNFPKPRKTRNGHVIKQTKRYQCKVCDKCFTTSGHLARHTRIHTGERKHLCPFDGCESRFARQDNCMQHYRTHLNHGKKKKKD